MWSGIPLIGIGDSVDLTGTDSTGTVVACGQFTRESRDRYTFTAADVTDEITCQVRYTLSGTARTDSATVTFVVTPTESSSIAATDQSAATTATSTVAATTCTTTTSSTVAATTASSVETAPPGQTSPVEATTPAETTTPGETTTIDPTSVESTETAAIPSTEPLARYTSTRPMATNP